MNYAKESVLRSFSIKPKLVPFAPVVNMKAAAVVSCLLGMANAVAVSKRESPLNIEIQQVGNSGVKASITNTSSKPLKIVKTGSILDSSAIEKSKVRQGSQ